MPIRTRTPSPSSLPLTLTPSNPKAAAMSKRRNLPEEIIADILIRLPVKSLFRFKCVSPLWKSLISDPQFAKSHLHQSKTINYPQQKIVTISNRGNLNLLDYNDGNPTSTKLEFPKGGQNDVAKKWDKVLSSCDGLLLVSRKDKSIALVNPSTRECKKLPICPFFQDSELIASNPYGVGYDASTDDYKVVMLSYCRYDHSMRIYIPDIAVYSLKTNAWRRFEGFQYQFSGQNKHLFSGYKVRNSGVFLNGCLHFLRNKEFYGLTIISVDLSSEIVREMPLPSSVRICEHVVLGGSLCLVDAVAKEIWMMKAYGERDSWTKLFMMCSGNSTIYALWMLAEDEFLLLENASGRKQLIVYNPHKFTKRVISGTPTSFRFWGTCVESLVSP